MTTGGDAGLVAYGQGAATADYDADGFPDLYLSNFRADVLLHNNGDGTYSDVTPTAGVSDEHWSTSAVWCDLDGDYDLDLYVCNYMDVSFETHKVCEYSGKPGYCGPGNYHSQPDAVYLNLQTVRNRVSRMLKKFGHENRTQLALFVSQVGDELA